jgi:hypothetical protein
MVVAFSQAPARADRDGFRRPHTTAVRFEEVALHIQHQRAARSGAEPVWRRPTAALVPAARDASRASPPPPRTTRPEDAA